MAHIEIVPSRIGKPVDAPQGRVLKVDFFLPFASFKSGFTVGLDEQGGREGEQGGDQGG